MDPLKRNLALSEHTACLYTLCLRDSPQDVMSLQSRTANVCSLPWKLQGAIYTKDVLLESIAIYVSCNFISGFHSIAYARSNER